MKAPHSIIGFVLILLSIPLAQTSMQFTSSELENLVRGQYNPDNYKASNVIDKATDIVSGVLAEVSPDSLESYLTTLVSFHNRNTGSDTVSNTRGIGAARRWVHSKFQEFSRANEDRLRIGYFQFNQSICGMGQHRNPIAILPGRDVTSHSIIIVEAHMDSRCESGCNITCKAHGADDNGSGTVLVMELARLLSKYTFNETIFFMATIGEEQGTHGANAVAEWVERNNIPLKAVQNNDVIGGVICGPSSSPPSCPSEGHVDSTHVRIFSTAINFSRHKAYARFVEEQYNKYAKPLAQVPMTINIMDPTDRSGRGGDHEPFSERGFTAIRFTSANEHGNGGSASGNQHTTRDVIGLDNNNDQVIDQYWVDFNYLSRNVVVNAMGLAMSASGPEVPAFDLNQSTEGYAQVTVTDKTSPTDKYLVGVRSNDNSFDYVFVMENDPFIVPGTIAGRTYYITVAALNDDEVQSLFAQEKSIRLNVDGPTGVAAKIWKGGSMQMIQKTSKELQILFDYPFPLNYQTAKLEFRNSMGKKLKEILVKMKQGENQFSVATKSIPAGVVNVSLRLDGEETITKQIVVVK